MSLKWNNESRIFAGFNDGFVAVSDCANILFSFLQFKLFFKYVRALYQSSMSEHYVRALCQSTMSEHYVRALCQSTMLEHYVRALCPSNVSEHYVRELCHSTMSEHYVRALMIVGKFYNGCLKFENVGVCTFWATVAVKCSVTIVI